MNRPDALNSAPLSERPIERVVGGDSQDVAAGVDESANSEGYRLISIEAVHAPDGCTGRDWLVYRIAQGKNDITGYKRGTLADVSVDVNTIVAALNGRRQWAKGDSRFRRSSTAARRKGAQ